MLAAILILVFLATFLIAAMAAAGGTVLLRLRRAPGEVADAASAGQDAVTPLLLREQELSTISLWHRVLERFDFVEVLKLRTAEAGLRWSVGRITLVMLLAGSSSAAVLFWLDWMPLVSAPVAGIALALSPYFYILRRRSQRFARIEEQFPDALDSLSRALRAGHPFAAGMHLVANEAPEPLASEIRRSCDEWRLGLAWNESLENFARRLPILEIRLFVAAVVLQSRFGGKLNEILEELAKTIRDSIALRGDVQAISAQGRSTGTVLTILPVAITAIMMVTSPSYIGVLLGHPYGKYLIVSAVVSLGLGHATIRKIVRIKV
ncbi:MAG TPA: type II secretion system F family protein [Bryobacteraceae bacterium]|nr:type II secretion system F family protein [Bryobacteraceae bacterium]